MIRQGGSGGGVFRCLDLITADENAEEEGEEREVEVGGGGLVQGEERQRCFNKRGEKEKGEQEEEEGNGKLSPVRGGSTCVVMEKFRPKRPTTLALFPQLPQAGTQDSINNNSLGNNDSWKDSCFPSPHITGDLTPPDVQPKAEDKVQQKTRRLAPKPPSANRVNSKASSQVAAVETQARLRERQVSGFTQTQSYTTARSQRKGVRGALAMRERSLGDTRGHNGGTTGKEDRRGGRLCDQSRGKEKERNGQRPRETNGLKSWGADGKGKVGSKRVNKAGVVKPNNILSNQEVYLTAMVVPRTPLAPRTEDKTHNQGQNHERIQDNPSILSLSSSEGGLNRMSLSSDTEGPPPGPPHPSQVHRIDTDISEEEGEGDPTPCLNIQIGPTPCLTDNKKAEVDCTKSEVETRGGKDRRKEEENRRKVEDETKMRREEDVKRRREEEVKRRRDVVGRICTQSKVTSTTTSEEEEPDVVRSKKFHNLFSNYSSHYSTTGAGSFGVFSCVLDGVERQQSHRAVYRFVPRHTDELYLETDDPVLMLNQSEDLWCQGYNMRTGDTGIFPAFYAVRVAKDTNQVQKDGWTDQFLGKFLGSVQVPIHKGNDMLCAAMQKVASNRRLASQTPLACVLEVSVKGMKISVQDQCHSAHRGDQCFHFFQLKNISFCGCHPQHNKYFGIITKHPDQQRFACHVMMSETTSHPLAASLGRAFQQYYKENIGFSCPTEDIFIE
uniref:C-Jun-amino-terminal kinase-interacting protein 2-like isoform X3 n=1 Tax=Gasterosteus aculeatus aculeatus TaxID=481459 RepID=UPI001A98F743|nr:C-Jun-amino-terminal kinase-interacting protein 2-like isoform X3 [Gasterosteus aculeatus aculeatus]